MSLASQPAGEFRTQKYSFLKEPFRDKVTHVPVSASFALLESSDIHDTQLQVLQGASRMW